MTPDAEDHQPRPRTRKFPLIPVAVAALIVVAAAVWFLRGEPEPEEVSATAGEEVKPEPFPEVVDQAPDIPDQQPTAESGLEDELAEPETELPNLSESDDYVRDVMSPLSDSEEYALWLQTENILPRAVTFIDGLTRGKILRKTIPVQPPEGSFQVVREDDNIWMDEGNYRRYDELTSIVVNIPPQMLSQVFHTLRPLFEQAYGDLGFPPDKADNSVIAAIDQVLAAPEIDRPIALKSKSVVYTYADPALEALPPLQKQMLRMGPENTARIKAHLREVRDILLAANGGQD